MKSYRLSTLLLFSFLFLSQTPVFANVLGNASFEEEIGSGVERNWDSTNDAVRHSNATNVAGFSDFPDGQFGLFLNNAGDFTFQTFDEVDPGDFVTFSAFAESDIVVNGTDGGRLKIEFKRVNPDGTDSLISQVTSDLITFTSAQRGNGFVQFTASGVAPDETGRIVFTLERPTGAGDLYFDRVNGEVNPSGLHVAASKNRVKKGEIVTMVARFTNDSDITETNVQLVAEFPPGIDPIINSATINGRPGFAREGSLILPVGNITAGQPVVATFQALVTSGVTIGREYKLAVFIAQNSRISATKHVRLIVEEDPVFDQGTIIGKVFHDRNQDGEQQKGEEGVPWVRIITEEGIIVITDEHGRYHIPAVKPGRHVVKIDGHTLPEGTVFITEESVLVKTTPGIMNKANFAVLIPPSSIPAEFQNDLYVTVTQGLDTSRPNLGVSMDPDTLKVGLDVLEKEPAFEFLLNYSDFVKNWYLEIRDEMGHEIWTGFGVGAPPREVMWTGHTEQGLLIKPGIYSYQFKVEDKDGHQDWTPLHFFRVVSKTHPIESLDKPFEIPPLGDFNIFSDGKRSIPLIAKPTIRIQGKTQPGYKVTVNGFPVDVNSESGLFQSEIYTSPGEKEILIAATSPEGETINYRKSVKVKDSTFFMVALGEEELGMNFQDGNIDTTGNDGKYKDHFYEDGRLSYYLRGKLKGKFLLKSHFDTEKSASGSLFTNLDPDDYYPIYGDASKRDYEANGSRDRFFIILEMDRSYIKWGSYETGFTDTELAAYNRTLSGFKANVESLESTPYGDSKRGFKLFWSNQNTRADHNEFEGTGGILYYLRNRGVVEGSEKLRVEIRDKIQDITLDSYELQEGTDYEIDYDEGRIMLSRPLSFRAASDHNTSHIPGDENRPVLIVDYEFEGDPNLTETNNRGIRGYTHMGDHIRIGATAVEEKRSEGDYDLRGIDATLKLGRNTKVTAELAESKLKQTQLGFSSNGGLSFLETGTLSAPNSRTRENAYLLKAESKPIEKFDIAGYVQAVEPTFSVANIRHQEGTKKYGLASTYKFHETFKVRYRYDYGEASDVLRPLSVTGVRAPFENFNSHIIQGLFDDGLRFAEAEYYHRTQQIPENNLSPSELSELPLKDAVAVKVGYHVDDRLSPYVKAQTNFDGKTNNQFGVGVRYQVMQRLFAYVEQMVGNHGDSTYFGFEQLHENGARTYANLRSRDLGIGTKSLSTAIGSSYGFTNKTRIYSEKEYSTYQGIDGYADIMGYRGDIGDHWDFDTRLERRHLNNATTRLLDQQAANSLRRANTFNTVGGSVGYADGERLRARVHLEVRRDQDDPKLWQWVTRNSVEYKITQDLSYLGKLDYGKSRFTDPEKNAADFMELSTGFAYRPVDFDKLNVLTRYTYIRDSANDLQFQTGLFGPEVDEKSHILAIDLAYDLHRYFGIVEKLAYKKGIFETAGAPDIIVNHFLWVNRINVHVTRKWDVALEYRALWQSEAADNFNQGALAEIDREIYDYVRLGVGYNFTDFDDDLSTNDYDSHGPFVRLTGKF